MDHKAFSDRSWTSGFLPLAILGCLATSYLHSQEQVRSSSVVNSAQDVALEVTLEIPRLNVSEYHRPYIAVWVEDDSNKLVQHLAVWFQQDTNEEGHGAKWLPDLRQWWRRGGRDLKMPVDGISGATRTVGKHSIKVAAKQLQSLRPGNYTLVVEASREVGGREVVKLPLEWPALKISESHASGETELGEVTSKVFPAPQS